MNTLSPAQKLLADAEAWSTFIAFLTDDTAAPLRVDIPSEPTTLLFEQPKPGLICFSFEPRSRRRRGRPLPISNLEDR